MKWFGSIVVTSLTMLFSVGLMSSVSAAEDAKAAANSVGDAVNKKFGSAAGIRDNAAQPLTSKETKLYTVDGTKSGYAQISRPASHAFVSIVAQPSGTGDLTGVTVYEDLNFDGTSDYAYMVPGPVSGICANGVILCNPGTWTDCKTFKWQSDASGKIALTSTSLDNLGGCYCVNSSCGSNLVWNNISMVMQDIGGGVVGGIQSSKAGIVITDVKSDGPSISYYGQDTTGTSTGGTGPGTVSETSYYGAPGSISSATDAMVASQSTDPKSYYSMMATVMDNKGSNSAYQTCTMNRQIVVDGPNCTIGSYNPLKQACDHIFFQQDNGPDNYGYSYSGTMTVIAGDTVHFMLVKDFPCGAQHSSVLNSVSVNGSSLGSVGFGGENIYWCTGENAAQIINYAVPADGVYNWQASGYANDFGSFYMITHYKVSLERPYSCTNDEYINDGCAALSANPDCVIESETVDGVLTYDNYNPTMLAPLPSTRSYPSDVCSQTVTRNWWTKERTYHCNTTSFDMDNVGKRVSTISNSVNDNTLSQTSFSYDDLRMDTKTGIWTADSGNISLPTIEDGKDCQFVCKTRKLVDSAGVTQAGPATVYRTSSQSYDFLYKTCDSDNKCPVEAGEELLKDCQCLSEFAEAATILMSLDAASKELICSEGTRK